MDEANERKMAKTFNMIVLGGLLKIRPIVSIESVVKALRKTLPERHHHLIPMNEEAYASVWTSLRKYDPYRKHTSILQAASAFTERNAVGSLLLFPEFHF